MMAGLAALVIRALCLFFADAQGAGLPTLPTLPRLPRHKQTPYLTLSTSAITGVVTALAREEESGIDPGILSTVRVGQVLSRMRLKIGPRTTKRQRTWIVTLPDLARWAQSYGLPPPEELVDGTLGEVRYDFEPLSTSGRI